MENAGARDVPETTSSAAKVDGCGLRAPRRHDPARARPHVVRRPRHDEVVGRPLAERVVRRVGVDDRDRRGDRVDRGLDDVRERHGEDLGLPPGPAALDPPDCRRHPRPRRRAGQLRRHHLRQGRVGAQAARRLGRPRRFFAGVRAYFDKHQWGNTELADLLASSRRPSAASSARGRRSGSRPAGSTRCIPEIERTRTAPITRFAIAQTAAADYPTIRSHRLGVGFYALEDGALTRVHKVELDVDGELTEVPELAGIARPDLVLLNDEDLAYAKIRLDERSLATAIAHLRDISDPLARSLVWGAAWDQTRDAEASATDYVDLVLLNIGSETESTTVRTTLAQLQLAANSYVAPDKRKATRERVADGLWALAAQAEPGTDSQLQFVTAFASAASTATQWEQVRRLRDGETVLEGLEIDTDLSWQLLISLAAGGFATAAHIEQALAQDNTSKGGELAAQAKAALPNVEAKLAAWDSLIVRSDQPNTIVRSTALGFTHPAGVDLLEEFVTPYFEMLLPIWKARSYQIAQYLITGLYPAPLANAALRDATLAWLEANADAPASLRRLVNENLAGVERADRGARARRRLTRPAYSHLGRWNPPGARNLAPQGDSDAPG